ncbi:MAG: lysophospholipid acyltransferase family protein [Acidimicrobiales bacterium]
MRRLGGRPGGFPFRPPTWPTSVERPPPERRTGLDYDTEWARRAPARMARALIVDLALRPVVTLLAAPRRHGLDGLDNLEGPVIFAANHHSHLDTPLLLSALPDRFRHRTVVGAGADYFFTSRIRSAVSALVIGAVPIERTRVNRRSADGVAALIEDGWNLVIFPEGGRSPDGWGRPFRGGAAYLALRCGRPVVPVHLEGTGRVLPRGARVPSPSTVQVSFGRPLWPTEGEDSRRFAVRIEAAVAALADERATDWWSALRRAASGDTPSLCGPPESTGSWRRSWALTSVGGPRLDRSERHAKEPRWPSPPPRR